MSKPIKERVFRWAPDPNIAGRFTLDGQYGGRIAPYNAVVSGYLIFHPGLPRCSDACTGLREVSIRIAAYLIKHGIPCSIRSEKP